MEGGRSRNEKETGQRTKRGLIGPMYSESPSLHRCGPDLGRAVHDVCDVDRRTFRGGARLWHWLTRLGRIACH